MILTCPECATRYFVADDKVGPDGKSVRCASCSHRWMAFPETEIELTTIAPEPVVAAESEPANAETPPAPEKTANAAPKLIREQAETRKTTRDAVVNGVVWAVMSAACIAVVVIGLVFRVDVVRVFPKAAGAYAMIGMPVNGTGLVFEDVSAQPSLQDGHSALVVSGAIRNIEKHAVSAPAIRIHVLDKDGHPVAARIVDGPTALIGPGQSHQFVVAVLDPPAAADDIEVAFAPRGKAAKSHGGKPAKDDHHGAPAAGHRDEHAAPAPHAPAAAPEHHEEDHGGGHAPAPSAGQHGAEVSLRGPMTPIPPHIRTSPQPILEAMEAKPLPSGSPYALHAKSH